MGKDLVWLVAKKTASSEDKGVRPGSVPWARDTDVITGGKYKFTPYTSLKPATR